MNKSEQINELATALAKAQGEIKNAVKDSANPYYKSRYADLASVWEACRTALSSNGLAVSQIPELRDSGMVSVHTMLLHSSGQWLSGELSMVPVKNDPQGIGSCITYIRRYALAAIVGISPEDDDGNAASGTTTPRGAVSTEARTYTRPNSVGHVPSPRPAEPVAEPYPSSNSLADAASHPPGESEHSPGGSFITLPQQQTLIRRFRESLPDELKANADLLRYDMLGRLGFVDSSGRPSSKFIPKDRYAEVGKAMVDFAKGMHLDRDTG